MGRLSWKHQNLKPLPLVSVMGCGKVALHACTRADAMHTHVHARVLCTAVCSASPMLRCAVLCSRPHCRPVPFTSRDWQARLLRVDAQRACSACNVQRRGACC